MFVNGCCEDHIPHNILDGATYTWFRPVWCKVISKAPQQQVSLWLSLFQFFFDLHEFCSALNVVISGCVLSSAQLTILAIAAYSFFTCLTGTAIVFIAVTIQQHS